MRQANSKLIILLTFLLSKGVMASCNSCDNRNKNIKNKNIKKSEKDKSNLNSRKNKSEEEKSNINSRKNESEEKKLKAEEKVLVGNLKKQLKPGTWSGAKKDIIMWKQKSTRQLGASIKKHKKDAQAIEKLDDGNFLEHEEIIRLILIANKLQEININELSQDNTAKMLLDTEKARELLFEPNIEKLRKYHITLIQLLGNLKKQAELKK